MSRTTIIRRRRRPAADFGKPFIVYGTLRRDGGNDHLWRGRERMLVVNALLDGYRLVVPTHGGFPYAVPAPGERTVVDVIWPEVEHADDLLDDLDWLEGVGSGHYERITATVDWGCGSATGWLYVAGARVQTETMAPVPENDWLVR